MSTKQLLQNGLRQDESVQRNDTESLAEKWGCKPRALIQLGAIVTGIRNSVKGSTYSQNRGGAYVKGKPIPTNRRTTAQTTVRAAFAANAKLWSGTLTPAQRAAWTLFAQNNPYTNVFGEVKQLSGMAMMMSLNQVLRVIGSAIITDAPSDLSVPPLAAIIGPDGPAANGTPVSGIMVDTAVQAVVAGAKWYVFATGALAGGKAAGQSDYRLLGTIAAIAAQSDISLDALYAIVFPGAGIAGQHIGVAISTVNTATGAVTPALLMDFPIA